MKGPIGCGMSLGDIIYDGDKIVGDIINGGWTHINLTSMRGDKKVVDLDDVLKNKG